MASARGLLPWEFARVIASWAARTAAGYCPLAAAAAAKASMAMGRCFLAASDLVNCSTRWAMRQRHLRIQDVGFGTGSEGPGHEAPGFHRLLMFVGGLELSAESIGFIPPHGLRQHGQQGPKAPLAFAILASQEAPCASNCIAETLLDFKASDFRRYSIAWSEFCVPRRPSPNHTSPGCSWRSFPGLARFPSIG